MGGTPARGTTSPSSRRLVALGLATLLVACSPAPLRTASSSSVDPPPRATHAPHHRDHRPPRVVTLAFAGDVHFQLNASALLDDPRGLGPISRVLSDADLTMVNLESAITERGTWDPKSLETPRDRFWFRAPAEALDVLADAGVDVVTVANNHGADLGAIGLHDTLVAARRAPLAVVGVGKDRAQAFTPYRVRVHGTELAVLAADTTPLESTSPTWTAGRHTPGLAAAREARPRALLRAVRRADREVDVVVVYLHWGRDSQACPTTRQRNVAQLLAAAGADVIVGSHAHVQLGSGWQDDTYVNYGLGNFVWYHDGHPSTGVLRLRLEDGHVVGDDWTPALIGPLGGAPVPLSGAARARAVADWRELRGCAGLASSVTSTGKAGFRASVDRITPALRHRMRTSLHPGCPVSWRGLRYLRLSYVGFDDRTHTGELVVAAPYAREVVGVFRRLYYARWPVRRMRLIDDYGGNDGRSMAADNTSGANCREVRGSDTWSAHAFGAAIDLNPVENPYLTGSTIAPPGSWRYAELDRSPGARVPDGVITADGVVVRAFADIGWEWGGTWAEPDFQHFSAPEPRDGWVGR